MKSATTNIPSAAYVRRGTQQEPTAFTLDVQLERLRAYAQQAGVELARIYSDQVNGKGTKPGLDQLLLDAQAGKFQTLYVSTLKTLNVQQEAALEITNRLQTLGIEVKVLNPEYGFGIKGLKMLRQKAAD